MLCCLNEGAISSPRFVLSRRRSASAPLRQLMSLELVPWHGQGAALAETACTTRVHGAGFGGLHSGFAQLAGSGE